MADTPTDMVTKKSQAELTTGNAKNSEYDQTKSGNLSCSCIWGCFRKYFCEGQRLDDKLEAQINSHGKTGIEKYRKLLAFITPAIFVHLIWWTVAIRYKLFGTFTEKYEDRVPYWAMSITMMFGSMIAGATSEGGASVAFPVMTLAFSILPRIAVDFSFMIQSVGMTAAALTIWYMKVKIEKNAVIFCSIGGTVGIIFGLSVIEPLLSPPYQKMYFVSIWFSFAFSLFLLNRTLDRKVFYKIHFMNKYKVCILLFTGLIGGIFSSIAGSGIDICSFATLTLLFRVSEKIATPTSVVLMAINTCVGFWHRQVVMNAIDPRAYKFWFVCIPIVVVGAPLGSLVGSHFHRLVLASFVYVTDTVQFVSALIIVKPWKYVKGKKEDPAHLTATSFVFVIAGWIVFMLMTRFGLKQIEKYEQEEDSEEKVEENKQDDQKETIEFGQTNNTDSPKQDDIL